MISVKRIVLDILKPHHPDALEFSQAIAETGTDYHVHLTVIEVDEKTETVKVEISGETIDFQTVRETIAGMGGSLHSIDEVEVRSANVPN